MTCRDFLVGSRREQRISYSDGFSVIFITRKINIALLFILASKVVSKLGNKMQSSVFTFPLFPRETIKAVFQWNNLLTAFFLGEYW